MAANGLDVHYVPLRDNGRKRTVLCYFVPAADLAETPSSDGAHVSFCFPRAAVIGLYGFRVGALAVGAEG